MSSSERADVSPEVLDIYRQIGSIRIISALVMSVFLGITGYFLSLKLDNYVIACFFLFQIAESWLRQLKLKQNFRLRMLKFSEGSKEALREMKVKQITQGSLYVAPIVKALLLWWVFSLLSGQAHRTLGITILMIFAVVQLIAAIIQVLLRKQFPSFIISIFLPVNVILWQTMKLGRPELGLLFWIESLIALILALIIWKTYKPENEINHQPGWLKGLSGLSALGNLKNLDKLKDLEKLQELGKLKDIKTSSTETSTTTSYTVEVNGLKDLYNLGKELNKEMDEDEDMDDEDN